MIQIPITRQVSIPDPIRLELKRQKIEPVLLSLI